MNSKEKIVIFIIALTSFMTTFTGGAVILSIPSIGKEFNSSASLLGWIITGYILSSASCALPLGRLGDINGRKKIFVTGLILFVICACAGMFAWSVNSIIAIRTLNGLAAAFIFSTNTAILISSVRKEKRGHALGLSSSATYIGSSSGPFLGGIINHYFGWRAVFCFTLIIGLISLFLAVKYLNETKVDKTEELYDKKGGILYTSSLALFIYGVSSFTTESFGKWFVTAGIVLMIVFVTVELKTKFPVIELRIFRNNIVLLFSSIASLINYSATFGTGFLLSIYFQTVMKYDSRESGIMLLIQPITMAIFSPIAGKISDKTEPKIISTIGMSITTLSLLFLALIVNKGTALEFAIVLVIMGFGLSLFASPNTNAIMGSVSRSYYGIVSSVISTMRLVGQSFSMAIITLLIGSFAGKSALHNISGVTMTKIVCLSFLFFSIICGVGIFFSAARGKVHSEKILIKE